QGAGQRSLGRRQLRPHASGAGPEQRRTRGAMSAVAAGARGQLREKARQFPVGAFVATGILATAIGAAGFLWALTTGQAPLAWLSWRFVRHDVAPDVRELADGRPVDRLEGRDQIAREAAILVVGYAFGYSLLAFDLMMSLAHKWVSNLFGAFYFMGSFLAALMALAVLAIALRRRMGLAQLISAKQLHDLGKLCFGFTVFWAYLMWAQYLV